MVVDSDERRDACELLQLKGDFLHNCAVFNSQTGVLFVTRRPCQKKPIDYRLYIPCIYSLGFVLKKTASKHVQNCTYKRSEYATTSNRVVKQGKVLLSGMTATAESSFNWQ